MNPLESYLAADHASATLLADNALLAKQAEALATELGSMPATLLARTDAALAVCAAAAIMRTPATKIERAFLGRAGWSPREGAVLVEVYPASPGLLRTIRQNLPGVDVVTLPEPHVRLVAA